MCMSIAPRVPSAAEGRRTPGVSEQVTPLASSAPGALMLFAAWMKQAKSDQTDKRCRHISCFPLYW